MSPRYLPTAPEKSRTLFAAIVPDDPAVSLRSFFGENVTAWAYDQIFAGTFGVDVFVRVSKSERDELRSVGGRTLAIQGAAMKGFFLLPRGWRDDPDRLREWTAKALSHVSMTRREPAKPAKDRVRSKRTIRKDS